jgi:hypothetical protein
MKIGNLLFGLLVTYFTYNISFLLMSNIRIHINSTIVTWATDWILQCHLPIFDSLEILCFKEHLRYENMQIWF